MPTSKNTVSVRSRADQAGELAKETAWQRLGNRQTRTLPVQDLRFRPARAKAIFIDRTTGLRGKAAAPLEQSWDGSLFL